MPTTKAAAPKAAKTEAVSIAPLDFRIAEFHIVGLTPLLINRFSQKAILQMMEAQQAGGTAKAKKKREPKDFEQLFEDAKHVSEEGWEGIHAGAFRNGAISACRTCGVVMTRAKLAFSVLEDGIDRVDGTPLVRLLNKAGDGPAVAENHIAPTRNATGVVDLRARPMYREWSAKLRIEYDAGMFSLSDLANLITRLGRQVGIGEGRPDSKNSAGIGFGKFTLT
jgi:hypothetical protein